MSRSLERALALRDALVAAVLDGTLAEGRLREASARIDAFRACHARAPSDVTPSDGAAIALRVARAAIAVVRGDLRLDVAKPATIVSFEGDVGDGIAENVSERSSLNLALRRRRVRSESLRVPLAPDAAMREMLVDVVGGERARTLIVLARRAHLHAAQRDAIEALLACEPAALVVSMLEPFDVAVLARARNVACAFGDEATTVEALAEVLTGAVVARGTPPLASGAFA